MSAEQEKDPISLKRVRGNREGRRVEGSGGSGARGGRVPAGREATGLCPGLTPRSPRPACAPGPGLRSEARGRRVPCAEPWPPRLCVRRQLKPHSASLHTPLLAHLTSLARHSTIGSSEGEKETPPGRDHERCPPPPPPKSKLDRTGVDALAEGVPGLRVSPSPPSHSPKDNKHTALFSLGLRGEPIFIQKAFLYWLMDKNQIAPNQFYTRLACFFLAH